MKRTPVLPETKAAPVSGFINRFMRVYLQMTRAISHTLLE